MNLPITQQVDGNSCRILAVNALVYLFMPKLYPLLNHGLKFAKLMRINMFQRVCLFCKLSPAVTADQVKHNTPSQMHLTIPAPVTLLRKRSHNDFHVDAPVLPPPPLKILATLDS